MQTAQKNGWEVVQDTAWEGYTKIPTWIMQGYATLADETVEQLSSMGIARPTHVLLQGGVGAMAGGVLGYLADVYGAKHLHSIIVEPELADCLYRSALKGQIVNVSGDMTTIMAGLACGEPNPLGWEVLRNCATQFVSCQGRRRRPRHAGAGKPGGPGSARYFRRIRRRRSRPAGGDLFPSAARSADAQAQAG
ncbi:diaminopropionate ammonia-lyase [Klebsiella michiganensis]|uniref:Diaminopropionate ammonia-lyase n=1 Tax=Klebsiella michiganensis TaxID=1134687 RepID=A0A7H4MWX8_9ENTR|nr:diaminopropionate ammonia-lyase [Klebsiella michiganensis]